MVYDTPRHSHCENEDIAKIIITHSTDARETAVDMDDTYEIPMNPVWNDNCQSEGTRTPDIIGGDSRPLTPSSIDVHSINSLIAPKQSFMGLPDSCNSSPSSPGYAFKYPSFVGLSSLYDTPRSSSSNLTEMIYDVPRNNEPVYENDNFRRDEDDFYESPKTSVVQR